MCVHHTHLCLVTYVRLFKVTVKQINGLYNAS